MENKPGHYWVHYKKPESNSGELLPSRFDGSVYYHGDKILHPKHIVSAEPMDDPPQCQDQCKCTREPDGTITIICS